VFEAEKEIVEYEKNLPVIEEQDEENLKILEFKQEVVPQTKTSNPANLQQQRPKLPQKQQKEQQMINVDKLKPIAKVIQVAHESPAALDGLKDGDEIILFGSLNSTTGVSLQRIKKEIEQGEVTGIRVYFRRMGVIEVETNVNPRKWVGEGLLGCEFQIFTNMDCEEKDFKQIVEKAKEDYPPPFAKISEVSLYSPANLGGIMVNDLIIQYGEVNFYNNQSMVKVASFTKDNLGKEITVVYQRINDEGTWKIDELVVVPGPWDGKGVLGCRFEPFDETD